MSGAPEIASSLTLPMVACAAVGAFAHWLAWRYGSVAKGLDLLIEDLATDGALKLTLKMVIYVGLGATIAVLAVTPSNARQAIAAGMAWTTLLNQTPVGSKRKQ